MDYCCRAQEKLNLALTSLSMVGCVQLSGRMTKVTGGGAGLLEAMF